MTGMSRNSSVIFCSDAGTLMPGTLLRHEGEVAEVLLDGDPFPVEVSITQIKEADMTDVRERTVRELRSDAKALDIKGYSKLSKPELIAAVEAAETAADGTAPRKRKASAVAKKATRKASPKKASTRAAPTRTPRKQMTEAALKASEAKRTAKADPLPLKHRAGRTSVAEREIIEAQGPNPYRRGTNIWYVTEQLLKGGKRQTLINRLLRSGKITFTEQVREKEGFDEEKELDHRLRIIGYTLRNEYGFGYTMQGRGRTAYIKVWPREEYDSIPEEYAADTTWETHGGKYLKVDIPPTPEGKTKPKRKAKAKK